ncbi:MAG: phospholipid carrier-dependent glycosyltransferase, partial [Proteobacteria bacterium]|nr:phospholipid carrier-dependent glycosyltransferase [Pseudomonadota bacterium]
MIKNLKQNTTFRTNIILIVILILLSAWALFFKLGAPNFYDIRLESRRAEIARNMLEKGDWIVPQLAGEAILTKPPLYFWAVALCSMKTGVDEFTARTPSAVFGIATVIFTFLLGSLLFNRKTGFYSALALMVTNIFIDQSRYAEMESMLSFFITSSIYFFCRG